MADKEIYIGCSGYYYKDWKGKFYPEKLPQKQWLPYYAEHFQTVEINNTFYRFPRASMFERWNEITPPDFKFTLKGSRFVTHIKKLKNIEESVLKFYDVAEILGDKVASFLWQFPPYLERDDELLKNFCSSLSSYIPQVIEFRHTSWFCEEIYDILEKYQVAYCIISAPGDLPEDLKVTSPLAYVRFHGKEDWYNYKYSEQEMSEWADKIASIDAEKILVYFNNDWNVNAVDNGLQLMKLLSLEYPAQ
ncbi:MAG: DUF72 domain-containing protein [Candidatus Cyclobacteriaceae bacterium M2_1C_046]